MDASEKLVYDKKSNRFYEAEVETKTGVEASESFYIVDPTTKEPIYLTREEKERVFLDSIQSYYFSGKQTLSDDEFDRLREDLTWAGSALVTLNRNETKFLNAMASYNKGNPVLTDKEFDELKLSLKESNSKIAVQFEPKCYTDSGICKVNWVQDGIRTTSLYVPATALFTITYLGLLYEVPFVRTLFNPIILLIIGAYPLYLASKQVTEQFLFKDPLVATGPCPSCGVTNKVFFGDVLGVEGDRDETSIKCTNCKTALTIKRSTLRVSTLSSGKAPPSPVKEDPQTTSSTI